MTGTQNDRRRLHKARSYSQSEESGRIRSCGHRKRQQDVGRTAQPDDTLADLLVLSRAGRRLRQEGSRRSPDLAVCKYSLFGQVSLLSLTSGILLTRLSSAHTMAMYPSSNALTSYAISQKLTARRLLTLVALLRIFLNFAGKNASDANGR